MIKKKLTKIIIAVAFLIASSTLYMSGSPTVSDEACHTANLYFEARGESKEGMKAIASVVLNRKNSKGFGQSDCAVIFQKNQFSWTHQQSFKDIEKIIKGDLSGLNEKDKQAFNNARLIASKAVNARLNALPDGTLYYHAEYIKPRWSSKMKRVKKIGKHIFYAKLNEVGYKMKS